MRRRLLLYKQTCSFLVLRLVLCKSLENNKNICTGVYLFVYKKFFLRILKERSLKF